MLARGDGRTIALVIWSRSGGRDNFRGRVRSIGRSPFNLYVYVYERSSEVKFQKRQSQHGSFEVGPAGATRPQRAKRAMRAKRGMLEAKRRGV